jgi:hypothetical protein
MLQSIKLFLVADGHGACLKTSRATLHSAGRSQL